MYKISFVVDHHPIFYYQAELLLFSLDYFSKFDKKAILVQCTNRVTEDFLAYLKNNNYQFRIIEPFLDGKYCNKVKLLEAFLEEENCEGIFLVDTDMFALEPLVPYNSKVFCAKTVDAPNPPLPVLHSIFEAAGLNPGKIISTDWGSGETLNSNFNGGYYFVPRQYIRTVFEHWQKWAIWLFERPELFEIKERAIHTDQVAMSMALSEAQVDFLQVPSNYNYPTHSTSPMGYFDPNLPISFLHYHSSLDDFGLLEKKSSGADPMKEAIEKANVAIADHAPFNFFANYRKSRIKPVRMIEKSNYLHSKLSALKRKFNKNPLFILHGGTSKTGTTSLQFFLDKNYGCLKELGILYPRVYMNTFDPKHQWLVRALMAGDVEMLVDNFKSIFFELSENTHTVILSTEGIYNHWNDFSQESKSFLSKIADVFEVQFWVWFREPVSFMNSLYRQNLKNPRIVKPCYGQDMSFSEMLQDVWFKSHLDYLGFIYEIERIFKKENISITKYEGEITSQVVGRLNIGGLISLDENENTSMSDAAIELLRIINRYPLNEKEKEHCVHLLSKIDSVIGKYVQTKKEVDYQPVVSIIQQAMANQKSVLKLNYQLEL